MHSSRPATSREIAQRIREGNQKRLEDQRRLQAIRQAYEESKAEAQRCRNDAGPTAYLPVVLVFLLFVSLPLSEQVVDWYLVGLFASLNLLYAAVVSEPSHWMNVLTVVLANLVLVRLSPYLYDVPALVMRLRPVPTAVYALVNVVLSAILYYGYVQQRFLFKSGLDVEAVLPKDVGTPLHASTGETSGGIGGGSGKHRAKGQANPVDVATLQAFVLENERTWRKDVAASVLLLFNVGALAYTGILPREVIAQTVRNLFRIIS